MVVVIAIDAPKYVDTNSEASGNKKVGRNAPCPCGSGKK